MVNGIRFFCEAGFFHDEIEILEKDNDISDKTVWELAHKQDYADSVKNSQSFLSQKWGF